MSETPEIHEQTFLEREEECIEEMKKALTLVDLLNRAWVEFEAHNGRDSYRYRSECERAIGDARETLGYWMDRLHDVQTHPNAGSPEVFDL